jgi:hypothetical protein
MSTRTKKREATTVVRVLPAGLDGLLSRQDVQRLLSVGTTRFREMLANGEYPRADVPLGRTMPRWSYAAHNAAVAALREKSAGKE